MPPLATGTAGPCFAASSFQNTCSEINYAYAGNAPTLTAVCLKRDGTANPTTLTLKGISNEDGTLTESGGAASFQQSCGNIRIVVDNVSAVSLVAFCRTKSGMSHPTSLPLNNISNENGVLTQ